MSATGESSTTALLSCCRKDDPTAENVQDEKYEKDDEQIENASDEGGGRVAMEVRRALKILQLVPATNARRQVPESGILMKVVLVQREISQFEADDLFILQSVYNSKLSLSIIR
jgi:hypothetical protein